MKLLHLADVHLGASYSGFGDLARARSDSVLAAFRRLPEIATGEGVDAVLMAGDLFDRPQPPRATVAAVRDTIRRLLEASVPVFLVPGNHDSTALRNDPYRELARGPRVLMRTGIDDRGPDPEAEPHAYVLAAPRFGEPVRVETRAGPLHVYGIAYDPAECADPLPTFRRADGAGVHVALLHASVRAASHWTGSGSSLCVSPGELATLDVDYVALGDHHRPALPPSVPGVPACYPGSFAACDLTEAGPRGYVVAVLEPGSAPRVEHRDAGVARVASVQVDASPLSSEVMVAEAVAREVDASSVPVVRLVGEPSFPLDAGAVLAELVERFGHAEVSDDTRFYASGRLDALAEQDTIAGHVVRLGRARIDEAAEDGRNVARQALRTALRALGVS